MLNLKLAQYSTEGKFGNIHENPELWEKIK